MYPGDADALIATGYLRLGLWDDEPADSEQARYDELDDVVATTGQAFLGLTVNCARCHDHKIDPIPQHDYYKILAFFQNINDYKNGGPTDERAIPMDESRRASLVAAQAERKRQIEALKEQTSPRSVAQRRGKKVADLLGHAGEETRRVARGARRNRTRRADDR